MLSLSDRSLCFFSTGTMLVPTLVFAGANALLLLVDTTGKPSFITRYRIQEDKNNPVSPVLNLLKHYFTINTTTTSTTTIVTTGNFIFDTNEISALLEPLLLLPILL